jgi:hypothetical protein
MEKILKQILSKIEQLDKRLNTIEKKMMLLGKANSDGYHRCEQVLQTLVENQGEVYETLCESAGVIESGTFFGN